MRKLRYEIDPYNRLVVHGKDKKSSLPRFRRVLDGKFKVSPGNSLVFHAKTPIRGIPPDHRAPRQLKLRGKWSLTKDHNLKLTLDNWQRQTPGDTLTLQGELIGTESNSILFAVTTRTRENTRSTNILSLQGRWQADKNNRLTFRIKREEGATDILTLTNAWEINKHHRIIYTYRKARLKRKKTLSFKGHWDITKRNRLIYTLDLKGNSRFDFRTSIGRLYKNYIKYEVGIKRSDKERPVKRVVTLFGAWKIKKGTGLLFEIHYEKGIARAIVFGAEARLTKRDKIRFRLKNEFGKDLGMHLTLSRKLLKGDGKAFIRLLKSRKESAIYVGMAWRR